jgi:hypothetical protein
MINVEFTIIGRGQQNYQLEVPCVASLLVAAGLTDSKKATITNLVTGELLQGHSLLRDGDRISYSENIKGNAVVKVTVYVVSVGTYEFNADVNPPNQTVQSLIDIGHARNNGPSPKAAVDSMANAPGQKIDIQVSGRPTQEGLSYQIKDSDIINGTIAIVVSQKVKGNA